MSDLNGTKADLPVGITGLSSTGVPTNPVNASTGNAIYSNLRNSTGTEITSASPGTAGNLLLHIQVPDTTTASTTLGALNATVSITLAGCASVGFQILAGTFIGTIKPECSLDGGTTWQPTSFYDPSNFTVTSSLVFASSNTTKIVSILPIGGSSNARVLVSAYTSGTANTILRGSQVSGESGAITSAAYSNITNAFPSVPGNTATLILTANTNRKYAYFCNDSGSQVNIQFGTSTGLSTTTGLIIPAKSVYELRGDNLFTGNVYAYSAGTITLSVSEGTP